MTTVGGAATGTVTVFAGGGGAGGLIGDDGGEEGGGGVTGGAVGVVTDGRLGLAGGVGMRCFSGRGIARFGATVGVTAAWTGCTTTAVEAEARGFATTLCGWTIRRWRAWCFGGRDGGAAGGAVTIGGAAACGTGVSEGTAAGE